MHKYWSRRKKKKGGSQWIRKNEGSSNNPKNNFISLEIIKIITPFCFSNGVRNNNRATFLADKNQICFTKPWYRSAFPSRLFIVSLALAAIVCVNSLYPPKICLVWFRIATFRIFLLRKFPPSFRVMKPYHASRIWRRTSKFAKNLIMFSATIMTEHSLFKKRYSTKSSTSN